MWIEDIISKAIERCSRSDCGCVDPLSLFAREPDADGQVNQWRADIRGSVGRVAMGESGQDLDKCTGATPSDDGSSFKPKANACEKAAENAKKEEAARIERTAANAASDDDDDNGGGPVVDG